MLRPCRALCDPASGSAGVASQVTAFSLERDRLNAEYDRMSLGGGRSAAERRRNPAPRSFHSRKTLTKPPLSE